MVSVLLMIARTKPSHYEQRLQVRFGSFNASGPGGGVAGLQEALADHIRTGIFHRVHREKAIAGEAPEGYTPARCAMVPSNALAEVTPLA
jgi:hypothetical protein